MTYPENVPALLTVSDFARRCGVSRPTAMKIIDQHPECVEVIEGGSKRVKASLLFSFFDANGEFVQLDAKAIKAATGEL